MEAIPVTERLPEASFKGGCATVLAYSFLSLAWIPAVFDTITRNWHTYGNGELIDGVTHWQPLPEAPGITPGAAPATERLPECLPGHLFSETVEACVAGTWRRAWLYEAYDREGKQLPSTWYDSETGNRIDGVTHWRPLATPNSAPVQPATPGAPRVEQPPSVPTLPGVVVPVPVGERLPGCNDDVLVWERNIAEWVPAFLYQYADGLSDWKNALHDGDIEHRHVTHWVKALPAPEEGTYDTDLLAALAAIGAEVARARSLWPAFNTLHEGYAIIAEELDEVWQHVKVKQGKRDSAEVRKELLETAAMCVRAVLDLQHTGFNK